VLKVKHCDKNTLIAAVIRLY